jgi:hypothetical protein
MNCKSSRLLPSYTTNHLTTTSIFNNDTSDVGNLRAYKHLILNGHGRNVPAFFSGPLWLLKAQAIGRCDGCLSIIEDGCDDFRDRLDWAPNSETNVC